MTSAPASESARFVVTRADDGAPLREALAVRLQISGRQAKALLDRRDVWVNRQRVWMAHHRLRAGDVVEVRAGAAVAAPVRPLCVLAADEYYRVVDKPAALLAVGPGSAEELARAQFAEPGLRAVHRLDRDTSGCLLLARTPAAFEAVVERFRTRAVRKVYHAVVAGRVERRATTVDAPVDGERARSHVTLLLPGDDASLVAVRIETGRTHQIRLHLASRRHPVLGDREHGLTRARDPRLRAVPRQMLHASDLAFDHPLARGEFRAHSPLPADFRRCLRIFGLGRPAPRPRPGRPR
jgi:23S rRNA pseudouridine1911/1915/1917 synthase